MSRVFGKTLENNLNKCKQLTKKALGSDITSNIGKENFVNDAVKLRTVLSKKNANPQQVQDYVQEIYDHLLQSESHDPEFSLQSTKINEPMRLKIVQFTNSLVEAFCLLPQTLFMSIDLFDQCVKRMNPSCSELELLAVTCLFMSCKYEEIYPPPLGALLKDSQLHKKQVIQKEKEVLQLFDFKVISVNTLYWVELVGLLLINNEKSAEKVKQVSQIIAELTLQSCLLFKFKKSMIAMCIFAIIEIMYGPQMTQFQWSNVKEKPEKNHSIVKILSYLIHANRQQFKDNFTL